MTRRTARWGVYGWNVLMLVWLAFGLGSGSEFASAAQEEMVSTVNAAFDLFVMVIAVAAAGNIILATLWLVSPER